MSTYNGAAFLREQIDSILLQQGVHVQLIVRDDGSTDATCAILDEYAHQGLLVWSKGENIGPAFSFMALLEGAPHADFYAFADQDDVWKSKKLLKACQSIADHRGGALYCGQTQLVDAKLNNLPTPKLKPRLTFGESQIYAFASGCTMVMNRPLQQFIINHLPNEMPMLHDFWVYTVTQAIGAKVYFDSNAYINYRQHNNNVVGLAQHSWIEEWKKRLYRIFVERKEERSRNTRILLDTLGNSMTARNRALSRQLIKAKESSYQRIRLFMDSSYRCGDTKTWLLFKLAILINSY